MMKMNDKRPSSPCPSCRKVPDYPSQPLLFRHVYPCAVADRAISKAVADRATKGSS